ncbi:MAG: DUF3883 domain-containing protein [Acidobacteria bacterium]|nr:DUF3883 domain-containing protein [Acidobacteriota bacterium]
MTKNELRVSREQADHYHLCRVFEFSRTPRFYRLSGALDVVCRLDAELFKAWVG